MNHDSDKTYKLPDWPEETEKPAATTRGRSLAWRVRNCSRF